MNTGHALRLAAASAVVALGVVVVDVAVPVVEDVPAALALPQCSEVIPVDALEGSVFKTGAAGALAVAPSNLPVFVGAGGAAPAAAAAGVTGATVALGAATFLASVYGTCKWLDWLVGDMAKVDPIPLYSQANTTTTGRLDCTDPVVIGATIAAAVPALVPSDVCRRVNFPASLPTGIIFPTNLQRSTTTFDGSLTIPQLGRNTSFEQTGALDTTKYPRTLAGTTLCNYAAAGTCATTARGNILVYQYPCPVDIGGHCGIRPDAIIYGRASFTNTAWISPLLNMSPEAREHGWSRRTMTDVYCHGSAASWVRAESAVYTDNEVTARIATPTCPDGNIATRIISQRVPINVTCPAGSVCWNTDSVIFDWTAPPALTTVGQEPEWVGCMFAGSTCGAPVLNTQLDICTWGGFTVANSFCTATRQAGTTANPVAMPTSEPTLEPVPRLGTGTINTTLQPTATEPPPPPTGTVTVPIEPGNGPRNAGPIPADEAECWPTGWGWFNPAEWVLKPIKCALVWAFVPTETFFGDLVGTEGPDGSVVLNDTSPYYPVAVMVELGSVIADEAIVTDAEINAGQCQIALPFAGIEADGTGAAGSTEVLGMNSIGANVCDGAGMTTAVKAARALSLVGTAIGALWMSIQWLKRESGLGMAKSAGV